MESQKCWKEPLGDLKARLLYHQQLRSSRALPRLTLKNLKDRNCTTHLRNLFPCCITLLVKKGLLKSSFSCDYCLCHTICNHREEFSSDIFVTTPQATAGYYLTASQSLILKLYMPYVPHYLGSIPLE